MFGFLRARVASVSLIATAFMALAPLSASTGCGGFIDDEKMARLRATGAPAEATIISIEPLGITINRSLIGLRLELDVPVEGGEGKVVLTRVFTRYFVSNLAIPAIQPKAKIPVKYDPRNPSDVYIDFEAMGYRF